MKKLLVVSIFLAAGAASAATHYVSAAALSPVAPYTNWATATTNIQLAINEAGGSGGLVLVTNGVYTGPGKSVGSYGVTMLGVTNGVTLRSVNGPEVTIINGLGNKRGVIISNAVVEGFTFTNCIGGGFLTYKGGGGALVAGKARLVNCILTGNRGENYGGGAAVFSGGEVSGCVVRANYATTAGGGLCMYEGGLVVDCVVSNNLVSGTAGARGGGIALEVGGVVSNCVIVNNTSHMQGGGVSIFTNGQVVGSFIACNIARTNMDYGEGGGAYLHQGGTMINCVFSNNFGLWQGGAVKFYYPGGLVRGCVMQDNQTLGWGGGIMFRSGGRAESCTIVNNSASDTGGGVYLYNPGGSNLNCIIYHNTGNDIANPYPGSVAYSCISTGVTGEGNITNEPAFVDLNGRDCRLSTNSPCINRATNQAWMAYALDIAGNPRICNEIADMGAFESPYWSRYEDADSDGLSDGDEESYGAHRLIPDTDGDSYLDGAEVYVGTSPADGNSVFQTYVPSAYEASFPVLQWSSRVERTYSIGRCTNLLTDGFAPLHTGLSGTPPLNVYTDETAAGEGLWFYRVWAE